MCGILGCYRDEGIIENDIEKIKELIKKNSNRGTMSYGFVTPSHYEVNLINPMTENFSFLNRFIGEKYIFMHLRSPTGSCVNNLYVTQPIIKNDKILLFNGMLIEYDKKYPTDTFALLDILSNYDLIEGLNQLKGSFALCYITNEDIYLIRCINSLYYNDNFFSSVKFDNCVELHDGEILNFKLKNINKFNAYTPYQYEN